MSRSSSNSTVMLARPWREVEEISLTPSTEVTASSTKSTTSVSMISGEAPSQVTEMLTTGKSTSGFWLTPRPLKTVAEAGEAQDAEADEGEHQDPREDVVADRDVRQGHPGRDLPGVLRGLGRPSRLVAHGRSLLRRRRPSRLAARRSAARPAVTISTGIPSARRSEPSITTVSPGFRPERISTTPVPVRSPMLDRPQLRLAVLHDVGHEALLARLDRSFRDHQRALALLADERHLGEEAGLELARVLDPGRAPRPGGSWGRRSSRRGRCAR